MRQLCWAVALVVVLGGSSRATGPLVLCRGFKAGAPVERTSELQAGEARVWACWKGQVGAGVRLMWYRQVGGGRLIVGVVRVQRLGGGWVGGEFVPSGGWHPGRYIVELVPSDGARPLAAASLRVVGSSATEQVGLGHSPGPTEQALKLEAEGWRLLAMGRLKEAEETFRKAIAAGNLTGAVQGLVEVRRRARKGGKLGRLINQAVEAMAAGRAEEAVGLLRAARDTAPQDETVARLLAKAQALAERRAKARLVVRCQPGARVWVDGEEKGRSPLELVVAAGEHEVEVRGFGGRESKRIVTPKGARTMVEFTLTGGVLQVVSYPWAEVYLDGKRLGTTPLVVGGLPLGRARLMLVHEGWRRWKKDVELRADRPTCVGARLEKSQ